MDLSAIALQAVQEAEVNLDQAATNIANFGATSTDGANADAVDISAEMVALLSAKNEFSANLSNLKTADEVQKSAIDLMA